MAEIQTDAPPAGEELHLPRPSITPLLNAAGITLALLGLTTMLILTWIGLAIFVVTTVLWIRDVRRDVAELPAEH